MKNTFPDIILKNIMSKLQPPTTVIVGDKHDLITLLHQFTALPSLLHGSSAL